MTWSYLCWVSYNYLTKLLYEEVTFPVISLCYYSTSLLLFCTILFSWSMCSWVLVTNSSIFLSWSLTLFCKAPTSYLWIDAADLSLIISDLFADMALCMSAHMRPYCWRVYVFLSMPLDSITYWFCSSVQLSTILLSKHFIILLASISCYFIKAVRSLNYLSWFPMY